jgi:hypothetical protein
VLRPADSPRLPTDRWKLCHPASPSPIAQRRRGSGYRVSESLPASIPLNQQVHQVLSDAPLAHPGFNALAPEWLRSGAAARRPRHSGP